MSTYVAINLIVTSMLMYNNYNLLILMLLLIKDNPLSLRCTSGSLLSCVIFENPKYTVLYWIVSRCGLRRHWEPLSACFVPYV